MSQIYRMNPTLPDIYSNGSSLPINKLIPSKRNDDSNHESIPLKELSPPSSTTSYEDGESCLNDHKTSYTSSYTTHATSSSESSRDTHEPALTTPKSSSSKTTNNSAREHEKYMKKRLKNKEIREKMKLRLERYTLERDALNLRIKECTNFLKRCICETVETCKDDHS